MRHERWTKQQEPSDFLVDSFTPPPDPRLHYRHYCRPKLANLLAATGLDAPYRAARGASLIDANGEAVTDFVGGFGAALCYAVQASQSAANHYDSWRCCHL